MRWLRAIAVWVLLMSAEVVHGVARTLFLAPAVGDFRARQLAVVQRLSADSRHHLPDDSVAAATRDPMAGVNRRDVGGADAGVRSRPRAAGRLLLEPDRLGLRPAPRRTDAHRSWRHGDGALAGLTVPSPPGGGQPVRGPRSDGQIGPSCRPRTPGAGIAAWAPCFRQALLRCGRSHLPSRDWLRGIRN